MRRLPVYLVFGVSESMRGEPIEALRIHMDILRNALRKDPYAVESAYISVITFADDANQLIPLTDIASFVPPQISAGGRSSLGAALRKVAECAKREVVPSTLKQKGDWRPLVFIVTDSVPTDDLEVGLAEFKRYKWGMVVACAAGDGADVTTLQKITENVVKLDETDQTSISAFFKWISASIATSSKLVDCGVAPSADELPPPPPEITLIQP